MNSISILKEFSNLYKTIQDCHICPNMDRTKALRLPEAINPQSNVFVLMQSLAENHLRKTGVNFFNINGVAGSTGKNLEIFLNKMNSTIYPPKEIKLKNAVIQKAKHGLMPVYSSDITLCYPGKSKRGIGDRKPNRGEVQNCIRQKYLMRELELIKPKMILLMGKTCRDSFMKYICNDITFPSSLSEHIKKIIDENRVPQYYLSEMQSDIYVIPIQHSSGANPRFFEMAANTILIKLIREVLV